MAAANPLEVEITCNVCYDFYEDPHVLIGCLHTYCLKCIKQLKARGQVQCPDCRTVTKVKDIKKDFKTQRLIDIHKHGLAGTVMVTKGEDQCGMCYNASVPITNHCTDCDIFLCAGCSKGHQTNKALKLHKLICISSILKHIGSNLKETISKSQRQVQNIDTRLHHILSQMITNVEQAKIQQIADVRKFTMDGIEDMKKNQKCLESLVNDANQAVVNQLNQSKNMLQQQKKDLLSKIAFLKDSISTEHIRTLQETVETVNETIKQDIIKIKGIIERNNVTLKSPITVQKNKNWDVKDSIEVSIDNIQYDSQQIGPVLETLYSELHAKTFTLIHSTQLPFETYNISLTNNELWCPGRNHQMWGFGTNDSLNVCDLNCNQVKEIKYSQIRCPESVATCGNEHVIVACRNDNGLHLLQSNGEYHSKITCGSFADVVCYDGDIFALEYETCKIIVLRRDINKWSKVNSYQLQHSSGSTWDRLCVQRSGIYVSSYNNNCIYVYDKHGQFQFKRGERGSDRPGQLNYPILCDVDSEESMLVADNVNHRLQVCNSSGQWTVVKLPGEIKHPKAVVVNDKGDIWIASSSQCYTLKKYITPP